MLFIRERRLWVWLQPAGDGATRITTAMSATRHTLDGDAEFDRLRRAILAKETQA
jgi:cytochrome c biogenesis protein